jgi:hypothetical protein
MSRPPFFESHHRLQDETLTLLHDLTWDELLAYDAWWLSVGHYLVDGFHKQPSTIANPLFEAPITGKAALWLATSGYYRQATALLRDMVDLVLWEWKFRQGLGVSGLDFTESKDKGVRNSDIPKIVQGSRVDRYRQFIQRAVQSPERQTRLLACVDSQAIQNFRTHLNNAVHGAPGEWNILHYPEWVPIPQLSPTRWQEWQREYCTVESWCATWCLFMFPDLMTWSRHTPLENTEEVEGCHDIWWLPALNDETMFFFHEVDCQESSGSSGT